MQPVGPPRRAEVDLDASRVGDRRGAGAREPQQLGQSRVEALALEMGTDPIDLRMRETIATSARLKIAASTGIRMKSTT